MPHTRPFTIVESASAAIRMDRAAAFLRQLPPHQPVTIVAATRGAADDLARRVARERGATMGTSRFSLTQLAARVAATHLAGQGIAPTTALGAEAIASRVAFDALRGGTLDYFRGVAATPGFPRALARTLSDLRLAGMPPSTLTACGRAGHDLAALASRAQLEMSRAEIADRARLLDTAAKAVAAEPFVRAPLVLLDVPIDTAADQAFIQALGDVATAILATVPAHDTPAREALERAGGHLEVIEEERRSDLGHLRACLFSGEAPEPRDRDG